MPISCSQKENKLFIRKRDSKTSLRDVQHADRLKSSKEGAPVVAVAEVLEATGALVANGNQGALQPLLFCPFL